METLMKRPATLLFLTLGIALAVAGGIRRAHTNRLHAIFEAGTILRDAGNTCAVPLYQGTEARLREALDRRDSEDARRLLEGNLQTAILDWEGHKGNLEDTLRRLDSRSREAAELRAWIAGDDATLKGFRDSLVHLKTL
jgi:hypothetical protein